MPEVTITDVMRAYAGDAVQHAQRLGVTLDYSEASLALVDGILAQMTEAGLFTPASGSEEEEAIWMLSKMYGGYLGEVVVRQLGGTWEMQEQGSNGARVVLRSLEVQMFPADKIYKRLTKDQLSGVSGYCAAVRKIAQTREEQKG